MLLLLSKVIIKADFGIKKVDELLRLFVDKLHISIQKCQEGKGAWYELRFSVGKFEVIATGGLCNSANDDGLDAFLGVSVPAHLINDDRFILFSPCEEVCRSQCYRMLRNYKRRASLYTWCSKSDLFCNFDFCTPLSLDLHRTEPLGYATVCSKLINLSVSASLKISEVHVLVDMLKQIECWKDLGFEAESTNEEIQAKLHLIKTNKIKSKLSRAKILLMDRSPSAPLPKARALGATLAAQAGVAVDDIFVYGNWSSK
ncbi:hypothetical protein G6F57_002487 [Rhizopus arrhizus]|nr:hypothetical protein G6F21_002495 [Rhizopus arrhizus]KAG0842186.1 hypothetical protein G6F18_002910 [Rhizopus arrhizus]KAG0969542.1 hypothetical protein G6F31_001769 [Rhizopus arrhizus]KAG1286134.1 hypothetical protein G6F65_002407 [Rhizopus arrhizus]KAG1352518.1 hypothetical protein G6F63_002208 [Rhizopus arrhizus]